MKKFLLFIIFTLLSAGNLHADDNICKADNCCNHIAGNKLIKGLDNYIGPNPLDKKSIQKLKPALCKTKSNILLFSSTKNALIKCLAEPDKEGIKYIGKTPFSIIGKTKMATECPQGLSNVASVYLEAVKRLGLYMKEHSTEQSCTYSVAQINKLLDSIRGLYNNCRGEIKL